MDSLSVIGWNKRRDYFNQSRGGCRQKNKSNLKCAAKGSVLWLHYLQMKLIKSFLNHDKSSRNQTKFAILRLIWKETDFCLVTNQSTNGKFNLIQLDLTWFRKDFSIVCILREENRVYRLSGKWTDPYTGSASEWPILR